MLRRPKNGEGEFLSVEQLQRSEKRGIPAYPQGRFEGDVTQPVRTESRTQPNHSLRIPILRMAGNALEGGLIGIPGGGVVGGFVDAMFAMAGIVTPEQANQLLLPSMAVGMVVGGSMGTFTGIIYGEIRNLINTLRAPARPRR